jgi:hypothetical protein
MSDSELLGGSPRLRTASVGPVEQSSNSTDACEIYGVS